VRVALPPSPRSLSEPDSPLAALLVDRHQAAPAAARGHPAASPEQRQLHARVADRGAPRPSLEPSTAHSPSDRRRAHTDQVLPLARPQKVLVDSLGTDWRSHFDEFDLRPFAAASIGQVHAASLSPTSPLADRYPGITRLAVKVQFPGVRESITSDLGTLRWLLLASAALPRGLYLDNTLRVLGRELDDECDYLREAECGRRMRAAVAGSRLRAHFDVPCVVDELSGPMVLTTEMMEGRPLKDVLDLDQPARDLVSLSHEQLASSASACADPLSPTSSPADRHPHHPALHARALRLSAHAD